MTQTEFPIAEKTADAPVKRCAILGTHPTWKQCPFHDKTLHLLGLNDGWVLGYPRVDVWFELHPFAAMVFYERNQPMDPRVIPAGTYLRPNGHLEFLKGAQIPVFLQEQRADIPKSHTFPKAEVLAFWEKFWPWRKDYKHTVHPGKDYEMSTPAWMFMWAVWQGYTEIHIYGVALSTEWEYLRQRPNLEFLIGVAAGLGVKVVLPDDVPVCRGEFTYGYEAKSDAKLEPVQRHIDVLKHELHQLQQQSSSSAWWAWTRKADVQARMKLVSLELHDAHGELQRLRTKVA